MADNSTQVADRFVKTEKFIQRISLKVKHITIQHPKICSFNASVDDLHKG